MFRPVIFTQVFLAAVVGLLAIDPALAGNKDKEPAFEISANVSLVSDYVWRGTTQNENNPALQGGFDVGHGLEALWLYAGVWGSNVDYGDNASLELDLYAGAELDVIGLVTVDAGFLAYKFPDEAANEGDEVYIGISLPLGSPGPLLDLGDAGPLRIDDIEVGATYSFGLGNLPDDIDTMLGADVSGFWAQAGYGSYDEVGERITADLSRQVFGVEWGVGWYDFSARTTHYGYDEDGWVFSMTKYF